METPQVWGVAVLNAGTYTRRNVMERMLDEAGLKYTAVIKENMKNAGFIGFASEEEKTKALEVLPTLAIKGNKLRVGEANSWALKQLAREKPSAPAVPQLRRPRDMAEGGGGRPAGAGDGSDAVTPWAGVPYPEQLARKEAEMKDALRRISAAVKANVLRRTNLPKRALTVEGLETKAPSRGASPSREAKAEGSAAEGAAVAAEETGVVTEAPVASEETEAAQPPAKRARVGSEADAGEAAAAAAAAPAEPPAAAGPPDGLLLQRVPEGYRSLLPAWMRTDASLSTLQGAPCPIMPILASPRTEAYRNKASFTIGFDVDNAPCVGSRIASFAESTAVALPSGQIHLSKQAIAAAQAITAHLREDSAFPVYDIFEHKGVWRSLTVRTAESTGESMVILVVNPPKAKDLRAEGQARGWHVTERLPAELKTALAASLPEGDAAAAAALDAAIDAAFRADLAALSAKLAAGISSVGLAPVTTFFLQEYDGLSVPGPNHPHKLVYGAPSVQESLCGLRFKVSPGAFFQVNSAATEELYALVRELALHGAGGHAVFTASRSGDAAALEAARTAAARTTVSPATTALLDVCCGTGTIGLVCASHFTRVVGVEMSEEAVEDAKANTSLNGVTNATWVCDKAENVMRDILAIASGSEGSGSPITRIVAVVDPPRGGLHPSVIKALRTCKPLKRIVYVSCNPTGTFVEDAMKLCSPQEDGHNTPMRGPEFRPVLSMPVDLFPHTKHCEMVTLFERD